MRFGIIGARRNLQGIGEYVARDLAAAGAEVVGVVGTRTATIEQAVENLRERFGLEVRGYQELGEMILAQRLDGVAICSPHQFHLDHLETALAHDQHVLCEKPLVFDPRQADAADARRIVEGFAAAGRVLMVNQQWPYTLPAFDQLYPDARKCEALGRLEVLLAPAELGMGMIPNAMPHVFSLLLSCAPAGGELREPQFNQPHSEELRITFAYAHPDGPTDVVVRLLRAAAQPRPAAFAINGCTVQRVIELPAYNMFFEKTDAGLFDAGAPAPPAQPQPGAERVALEDPLRLLVTEFIRRVEFTASPPPLGPILIDNVRLVQQIYQAAAKTLGP